MNKTIKIMASMALLLWSAGLSAQTFDIVERRDFWNAGRNVNGLRTDSLTISYAALSGDYTDGGFRDVSDPVSLWGAGAEAGTITHLKTFSMIGAFSFRHSEGRDACGSMSARPGYWPVDIYEFTPGRKTRQTYSFLGGITVDLNDSWRLGGKMEFLAENYTKRKDLRHTDYLLDMTVAPGVMWHRGDFAVGASYVFSKNSETITAEELGITSGVYYAFIDKGMMYGIRDIWDNSSLHIKESGVSGFPSRELANGGAVQFQWRNLYADFEALYHSGSTGEKQKMWYGFGGWSFGARMDYRIPARYGAHYLRGNWALATQDNDENVLEDVTENGVTITRKYGSNRIYTRQNINAGFVWELLYGSGEYVNAGFSWNQDRELSSIMYPFVNTCRTNVYSADISVLQKFGSFDCMIGCGVSAGNDDETHRSTSGIETGSEPFRLDEYEAIMTAYRTAARVTANAGLRYNFRKGIFMEVDYDVLKLRKKSDLIDFWKNTYRQTVTMKVGYNF